MSVVLVTPPPLDGAIGSELGALDSLAGADACPPVAGACELLHAPTTPVRAAKDATAASR